MKEWLKKKKDKFLRKIKRISILTTVAINLIYIAYLWYSLGEDIGNKIINFALIIGTAIFLVIYLFLQLLGRKGGLKTTKRFYKRFKLATKVFTTGTAIYSLITAAKSVSSFAMTISVIGAVFLGLRIIGELLVSLIERGAKKLKESMKEKRENRRLRKYKTDNINVSDDDLCSLSEGAPEAEPTTLSEETKVEFAEEVTE